MPLPWPGMDHRYQATLHNPIWEELILDPGGPYQPGPPALPPGSFPEPFPWKKNEAPISGLKAWVIVGLEWIPASLSC